MLKTLFAPDGSTDPYKRGADQRAGAWSILTGIAANQSMARGQAIPIEELVHGLEEPDYPPMPSGSEPIDAKRLKQSAAQRTKNA
jgi:hypothetical protein